MKILVNGNFITMNNKLIEALVFDDKIYYAGGMKEALKFDGEIVDLKGKTVIPGLIDITTGFINLMERKSFANLINCNTIEEVKFIIESKFGMSQVIVGYGYDVFELKNGIKITNEDIDYEIPIILLCENNNKALVNYSFMKKYNINKSIIYRNDLKNLFKRIPEIKDVLSDNIPYTLDFYYEKGFTTQTIKVLSNNVKELINKMNYSNMVMIGQNDDFGLKSRIILIDTAINNYLLYSHYELSVMIKNLLAEKINIQFLVHSKRAIKFLKEVLACLECDLDKCTLMSPMILELEDIIFFARKNLYFSVLLSDEFKMRKKADYNFFDYFIFLEKYDIGYSIYDLRTVDEFNIFEELCSLFKERHFYEGIWKKRLYNILKAMTINKAQMFFLDDKMGKIEDGYAANLVVLNNNPFETLEGLNVLTVYKNGKVVYSVDKK